VSLVGDFNGWTKGATQLLPGGQKGTWIVSVPLSLGRHEYAFIVDGQRWVADPFAMPLDDEFGTHSSVVMLGDAHG
jgi:1,4-alpha-glucan branching enzyme